MLVSYRSFLNICAVSRARQPFPRSLCSVLSVSIAMIACDCFIIFSAQNREKRLFSETNTSVFSEGIFDSESNQNLVGATVCENPDYVINGMVDYVNDFSADESDFVMCDDSSSPDCVVSLYK
ncbi:hypothetical protein NPIL_618981 [Nephila pilipes]|uniref:Uncharacterized protein n=1 Tax=Nephila pilipes TaxID=299642 RepID=A0A8X6KQ17_NEPPI|nr:hypothetical protein NPIL_279271 [Nephila pilipes]GFS65491.1 hypothetical protein NPIL_618981 [Nephila pilipes]